MPRPTSGFNEAGAMKPRKSARARVKWSMGGRSFNEAGAMKPRKSTIRYVRNNKCLIRFNEAGAMKPRKSWDGNGFNLGPNDASMRPGR